MAPEYTWVAHPDVVSKAIYILAGSVISLGGALIKTYLYIDKKRMEMFSEMATDIKTLASDMREGKLQNEHRITRLESRVDNIEEDVTEMGRLCEDRRQKGMHH